jgi:hypothetical protein
MSPRGMESPEPQFVSAVLPSEEEQYAWAMRESTSLAVAEEQAWETWDTGAQAAPPAGAYTRSLFSSA